jgi:hypothetical protein
MDNDPSKEIEHSKKGVSSVGIVQTYASGQAQAPKPLLETSSEDKPKRKRKVLRLDQIVGFSPIQPGQRVFDISNPDDQELADSIRETGQQEPITVAFLGMTGDSGTYELVNGHRRYGAIRYNAGKDWAGAKIEGEILNSSEDKTLVALHVNRGVMPLSPPQRGELYQKLRDRDKLSVSQICKRYHLAESEEYITRLIMAWDSPDPVRSLFRRGFPINRTMDLRGVWNRLPDSWRKTNIESFSRLSLAGASLFVERIRNGSSPDTSLQEAQALSPVEEISIADSARAGVGQGANAASARPAASKGKHASKEDHNLLEPLFSSLGLPSGKISELKRAGGSDNFEELTLAALAVRRGLDTHQALSAARSLTHSRSFRHVAHRLVLDISKVLTKSVDVPEYQFLKYILSLTDTRPCPQPASRTGEDKKSKSLGNKTGKKGRTK